MPIYLFLFFQILQGKFARFLHTSFHHMRLYSEEKERKNCEKIRLKNAIRVMTEIKMMMAILVIIKI